MKLSEAERRAAIRTYTSRSNELMQEAEKGGVHDPVFWTKRGDGYLRDLQWDRAAAAYTKAIALKPEDWWLRHERCYAYLRLGQFDKVLAESSQGYRTQYRELGLLGPPRRC